MVRHVAFRMRGNLQYPAVCAAYRYLVSFSEKAGLSRDPAPIAGAAENRNTRKAPDQSPVSTRVIQVVVRIEDRGQPAIRSLQIAEDRGRITRIDCSRLRLYIVEEQEDVIVGQGAKGDNTHCMSVPPERPCNGLSGEDPPTHRNSSAVNRKSLC
jgi:hypothetical protein